MWEDMQRLLNNLNSGGLFSMLDIVLNHMGYGSTYPSFNYYFNPFNQQSNFIHVMVVSLIALYLARFLKIRIMGVFGHSCGDVG